MTNRRMARFNAKRRHVVCPLRSKARCRGLSPVRRNYYHHTVACVGNVVAHGKHGSSRLCRQAGDSLGYTRGQTNYYPNEESVPAVAEPILLQILCTTVESFRTNESYSKAAYFQSRPDCSVTQKSREVMPPDPTIVMSSRLQVIHPLGTCAAAAVDDLHRLKRGRKDVDTANGSPELQLTRHTRQYSIVSFQRDRIGLSNTTALSLSWRFWLAPAAS